MTTPEEALRYQDVPPNISHALVDACWEFADGAHWTIEDLTTATSLVFNARTVGEYEGWRNRLAEAKATLELVSNGVAELQRRLRAIEEHVPK